MFNPLKINDYGNQETGYLSENVLPEMHIYTKFDLDAKVRISKVRQGFRNLLCCA